MPVFLYTYLNPRKRYQKGQIEAPHIAEAKEKLHNQGLLVTDVKLIIRKRQGAPFNQQALLTFTGELYQLLTSGLPLFESLSLIAQQYETDRIYPTLAKLCKEIEGGKGLSQAMEESPKSFPPLYTALIASGEASGSLEGVLSKLVDLLTKQQRLRKQIATAMVYPAVIGSFCLLVIFLLLTFAVPSIKALYGDASLSPFTHLVLGVSDILTTYWPIYLTFLFGAVASLTAYFRTPKGKIFRKNLAIKTPLIKTLLLRNALARFTRTLATLQQGGVSLIDALSLAEKLLNHPTLESLIGQAKKQIVNGSSLSAELKKSPLIPPMVTRMLAVGEESGQLPRMLEGIASFYEEEVERAYTRLTSLAQPAILILMGGIIGVIMLAVLLPLTDVSHLM